jgi:hypothetical protein
MKPYEELKSWSLLFDLNGFIHELIDLKQIIFYYNLGPNKEPKSAQISHYWP